jgi:hypothetical protein
MPMQFLGEDAQTFTVDAGNGPQQVAKTPDMLAPGGVYDQAKASVGAPLAPDAPIGVSQPPPSVVPPAPTVQAPSMQQTPPGQEAQPGWAGTTGVFQNPTLAPANQIPMQSAQNADPAAALTPAAMPQQAPGQQMPPMMSMGTSGTTISSNVIDPKARDAYMSAIDDGSKAIQNQGKLKGDLDAALAQNDQDRGAVRDQQAKVEQDKATMIAKTHEEYQQNVTKAYQDLAQQKITPKPIFEDGNIGQNLAAGLAIGLGALGQAMTHGSENVGLKVIQTSIDRDMKAQQANIDNKRASLNDLGVAIKAGLDMGMSEKDAQIHAKTYILGKVADQAEQMGHVAGSQIAAQNGAQMAAGLRAAGNETIIKATGTAVQRSSTSQDVRMPIPKLDTTEKDKIVGFKNTDDTIQDMRDYVKSAFGPPPTGKAADVLRETGKKFGIQDPNVAVLQQKLKANFIAHNHEMFGSRITDPEIKQMSEVLPSYEDNPDTFMAKLNEMDRTNAQKYGVVRGTTGGMAEGFKYPELRSQYWSQYRGGGPSGTSSFTPTMNMPQTHHKK